MTKYQQYLQDMLAQNKELFDRFKTIHDSYSQNPQKWQSELNQVGYEVQDVIRRYENRLCGHSETSGYGKFTTKLANKFQEEVRSIFPNIDAIGKF